MASDLIVAIVADGFWIVAGAGGGLSVTAEQGSASRGSERPRGNGFMRFLRMLGPGVITGAADDDPSGIATYSQTGAQFGFGQLWTALYQVPLLLAVQEPCGRMGR